MFLIGVHLISRVTFCILTFYKISFVPFRRSTGPQSVSQESDCGFCTILFFNYLT